MAVVSICFDGLLEKYSNRAIFRTMAENASVDSQKFDFKVKMYRDYESNALVDLI